MSKKKKSITRVLYRDKLGRFSKLDKRKKLTQYLYYNTGKIVKSKLLKGSFFKKEKTEKVEFDFNDDIIFKGITSHRIKKSKYQKRIEFTKSSNQDYHSYLSNKKFNQIVSTISSDDNKIIASIRIKTNTGVIAEKEVQITGIDFPTFGIYSRRNGKKYTAKDIVARTIHQMLADSGLTPYQKGLSDGSIQKQETIGKKRFTKRQDIQIDLRSISIKSRKKFSTIDKYGHIKD